MTDAPPAALQRRRLTTAEVSRLARMLRGQGRWADARSGGARASGRRSFYT